MATRLLFGNSVQVCPGGEDWCWQVETNRVLYLERDVICAGRMIMVWGIMFWKRRVKTDFGTRLELFGRPRVIVTGLLGEKT